MGNLAAIAMMTGATFAFNDRDILDDDPLAPRVPPEPQPAPALPKVEPRPQGSREMARRRRQLERQR